MQSLRVDGTVLVEAALDVTGHVEPGSAKIVKSPNHAFDEEALRVVRGSVYRPARNESRAVRSEEHTSELQSQSNLVCRLLLEKKKHRSSHIFGSLGGPCPSLGFLRNGGGDGGLQCPCTEAGLVV